MTKCFAYWSVCLLLLVSGLSRAGDTTEGFFEFSETPAAGLQEPGEGLFDFPPKA